MHPQPKTAPQSGERRARRRPASEQGPDLAQLQHPPLLLSERGRGTSDAGGEQGRARRARGGSRRECAAPGPAAPPSAASVAPPARLHGRRGLLRLPRGSPGSARAPEPPRPPLRSAACRRGGEPGRPWRPAPSAPELRPARGPRHLCRRRRRERGSSRRAQQLSPRLSPGGRLRRLASERASAPPPPKAAPGAEHAQCRRQSGALRHANSTSGFRGGSHSSREGRRRRSRLGEGRASSGARGTRARTGVETLAGQMPVCKRVTMEGFYTTLRVNESTKPALRASGWGWGCMLLQILGFQRKDCVTSVRFSSQCRPRFHHLQCSDDVFFTDTLSLCKLSLVSNLVCR